MPALVQSKHFTLTAATSGSVNLAFTSPVTAGNLIDVWVTWGSSTATVSSVGDSRTNAYTELPNCKATDGPDTQRVSVFYAKNVTGGSNTVTASFSSTVPWRAITISEWSGCDTVAPQDQSSGSFQSAVTTATAGPVTTTANGELVVTSTFDSSNASSTITPAQTVFENNGATDGTCSEYQVQGTAGSISGTFTLGAARSVMTSIRTYKAASGGGGGPTLNPPYADGILWPMPNRTALGTVSGILFPRPHTTNY